jgi:hypothetical protein
MPAGIKRKKEISMKTPKRFLAQADLKRTLQITIGSLLLAAGILSGCASWPTEGPSGTFTITGIPSEYEGKFVKVSLYLPPQREEGKLIVPSPKEVARGPAAAIRNGELTFPLYGKEAGYFASDTVNVCLRLRDTEAELGRVFGNAGFDFIFAEVPFENGVTEVQWDDQVTPGFINVTNIPPEFADNTGATVYIGNPDYELKVTVVLKVPVAQGAEATCTVAFPPPTGSAPRIGTGKFIASEYGRYRSFPQSGTRDVVVQLATFTDPNDPRTVSYSFFRFRTAPIQDGGITLDLSRGVRR